MRLRSLLMASAAVFYTLFDVCDAQKKVSVSEVTFDSAVDDVQYAGPEYKSVIVKSVSGRLYRSEDGGRNWVEITASLRKSVSDESLTEIVVDNFKVNPVDKSIVMVASTKHHHFISTDSGKSWRHVVQNMPIHAWQWHPTNAQWALFSLWSEGCTDDITPPEEKPCNHMLYYTKDLAKTSKLVQSYVVQYSWGDESTNSLDKIFFTHHKNKHADQPRFSGWSKMVDFSMMTVPSNKIKTLVPHGNKFLVSHGYIFVACLTNPANQAVDLFVSTDGGSVFQDSILPFELLEKSYTILDASGKAVMLHVNHGEESKAGTGHLYVSDESGLRFALSLPGNVRSASGECEFDRVQSLEGVYLANYKEFDSINNQKKDAKVAGLKDKNMRRKGQNPIRTVVSFDKGAIWNHLKPPKIDSLGKPVECANSTGTEAEKCWLHLHGVTNFHNYAPFYSAENAVGLVMGTGNIGPYLRHEPEVTNTYLSRDGGLNWVEVHKGAYIYEFGDHGGLVVMADDLRKTKQVVFSWNEGQNWFDFDLGGEPLDVDNIIVDPTAASVEFLLYGTRGDAGVLYHLDFKTLSQPPCKGVFAADSVSSDYETWSPTNGHTADTCLLGRHITYTRRKQASECFNGQSFNRPVTKQNCQCSLSNFECEFGFSRAIGSTECRVDNPRLFEKITCQADGFKRINAYRKVPGDSCEGGFVPDIALIPCDNPELTTLGVAMRLFSGVAIVAVIIFILFFFNNGSIAQSIMNVFSNCFNKGLSMFSGRNKSASQNPVARYEMLSRAVGKSSKNSTLDDDPFGADDIETFPHAAGGANHQNFASGVVAGAMTIDEDDEAFRAGNSSNLDAFGKSALASRVGRAANASANNPSFFDANFD